ncbi:MAG: glycosyltransferase [Lewinellaceae bacterium]|nr:glycosyltransferase [Lewinellaceae bacterium]
MHILIVNQSKIPVHAHGGTERIIWWLGKNLVELGHQVTYLVEKGSECPFAKTLVLDPAKPLDQQLPEDVDLVHLHCEIKPPETKPYLVTKHDNCLTPCLLSPNTVFLSRNHALRHGGSVFVYNGLDFEDYGTPVLEARRMYFHFLAKASWPVKNVRGAIDIAGKAGERLHVIGGSRVNFRRDLRVTFDQHVRFHGMIGGDGKNALINASKGLLFPVLWHEPFGLGIIESLYFGCPVFGTPYGSLPELLGARGGGNYAGSGGKVEAVYSEFGYLSIKKSELVEALKEAGGFDRARCQEYVVENFSAQRMTNDYLALYEQVLQGKPLHAEAPQVQEISSEKFLLMEP